MNANTVILFPIERVAVRDNIESLGGNRQKILAIECLRAVIYKTCELEHPLRKAMDDMIGQIESYDDDPDPNIA